MILSYPIIRVAKDIPLCCYEEPLLSSFVQTNKPPLIRKISSYIWGFIYYNNTFHFIKVEWSDRLVHSVTRNLTIKLG